MPFPERAEKLFCRSATAWFFATLLVLALQGVMSAYVVSGARAQTSPGGQSGESTDALLDASVDAVLRAEFDRAETLLTDVRSRLSSLSEWRRFLMSRAALAYSLRDEQALRVWIQLLRALSPDAHFDERFPPDLGEALARVRRESEPLGLIVEAQPRPEGVRLFCAVTGLPDGLEAAPVLFVRGQDGGYNPYRGCDAAISLSPAEEVAYYAEVRLPNGVVAHAEGTAEQPLVYRRMPAPVPVAMSQAPGAAVESTIVQREPETRSQVWWWVGGGVAVAVVAAVVTTLLLTSNSASETQPSYPVVR